MLGAVTFTLRRVRRVRPATAFPFTLGLFSGTLITAFLVLALRSIDTESSGTLVRERLGGPFVDMEGKVMPAVPHEDEPVSKRLSQQAQYVMCPKKLASYNVISSREAFRTRGFAIHRTWGSSRTKSLSFYLFPPGEDEEMNFAFKRRIPVVSKKGFHQAGKDMTDLQEGVFQSWRYICEEKSKSYQWYIVVKDTAYLRVEGLEQLLSHLNSSKPLLIGRSVMPVGHQRDELGLKEGDNYCLEAGYVVSAGALELLCPKLPACQLNAMSENEDVEIARCIRKYARTNCTTASEVHIHYNEDMYYQLELLH